MITVEAITGKTITLDVEALDTVWHVKLKIWDKWGMPADMQRLLFKGEQLEDGHPLFGLEGVPSYMHLVPRKDGVKQIFVITAQGNTSLFDVDIEATLYDVKTQIQDKLGIPRAQQLVKYASDDLRCIVEKNIRIEVEASHLSQVEASHLALATPFVVGRKLSVAVAATDTIENVKQEIHGRLGIKPERQRLIFEGEQLGDGRTVSDCNIENDSLLYLLLNNRRTAQVFVKMHTGKTIDFEADLEDTVDEIKAKILDLYTIPPSQLKLTFAREYLRIFWIQRVNQEVSTPLKRKNGQTLGREECDVVDDYLRGQIHRYPRPRIDDRDGNTGAF